MAKKKSYIGSITFIKEFPRKRPGRHAKSFNKRLPKRKKQEDKDEIFSSYSNIVS
jgi:hypothetical protein